MDFIENEIVADVYPMISNKSSIMFEFLHGAVKPRFDTSIPTACVSFVRGDEAQWLDFKFNPEFWARLSTDEKYFVFVHEILHVLFRHGIRGKNFLDSLDKSRRDHRVLNIAMDICINELIVREYIDTPRSALPIIREFCFIDTVFREKAHLIEHKKSFEYYYEKILEHAPETVMDSFDSHENLSDIPDQLLEVLDGSDDMSEESVDDALTEKPYGLDESASDVTVEQVFEREPKSLAEYLERYIASRFGGREKKPKVKSKWYGVNRRTDTMLRNTGMFLPVREEQSLKKGRKHIVAYCDVSGSVSSISTRMMNLIYGLDQTLFDLDVYAFASTVVKTEKNESGRIHYKNAGHGTNIENVLRHYATNYRKSPPDATIVLTDGRYMDIRRVSDVDYSNWSFFMTCYSDNHPPNSKNILLQNL